MSFPPPSAPFATIGSATVAQMEANRIFQRASRNDGANGLGQAMVPVSITVTGGVIQYTEYQLRNVSGGAVLQTWTALSGVLAPNTSTVYAAVPAFLGWYYIDVRVNGSTVTTGTSKFAVGELIGIAGQSLAQTFLNTSVTGDPATLASLSITPSPYSSVLAAYCINGGAFPAVADNTVQNYPPAWQTPADGTSYNGAAVTTFLNLMVTQWGVPCGVVGYAVGGTAIASWLPGYSGAQVDPSNGTTHWARLSALLTRAGGAFGAFFWDQGHYETKDSNAQAQYVAQLKRLFNTLAMQFPAAAALKFKRVVGTIPAVGNYGGGPVACNNVRMWAKAYVATDPDAAYFDGLDVTLWSDLVHPAQAGGASFGQHVYRALANAHGLLLYPDSGPVITGITRAFGSATAYLTVAQNNNGTAFVTTGTPVNQFSAFPSGQVTSPYTISSISTINPLQIALTLSAIPTEPAAIDWYYRLPPDTTGIISSGLYDNITGDGVVADGITTGRQLTQTPYPLTTAAYTTGFSVNIINNTTAGTAITVGGQYMGDTLTAVDYASSVASGASWTAATSPTITGSSAWGTYSFSIAAGLTTGAYQIQCRDHTTQTYISASPAFFVSPVSPVTLASNPGSLVFSWDASANNSCFQDALPVPMVAAVNGSIVRGFADLSGNGNIFSQAGAASLCPTYATNVKNGLPGVRFTGASSQFLQLAGGTSLLAAMNSGSGWFMQIIFTPATLPGVAADAFAIGSSVDDSAVRPSEFRNNGSTYVQIENAAGNSYPSAIVASGASAGNVTDMISRFDGTTQYNYTNGLTEVTIAKPTGTYSCTTATIGAMMLNNAVQYYLDGWVHEIRVYAAFGTTQNKTDAHTYSVSKWGA